ncbi:MAG: DNA polymerase Y family protein [Verrucomicrobiales bacterium]
MFCCLYLPRFPLEAVARAHAGVVTGSAVAVLDGDAGNEKKAIIVAVSSQAEASRVERGMTATQGLARCGGLALFYRDRDGEEEAQLALLEQAGGWTPHFENTAPGICTLDLVGVPDARKNVQELAAQMAESLHVEGFVDGRVGIAGTPDLAFIAARMGDPVCVLPADPAALRQRLAGVPIMALLPSPALLEVLDLWGVRVLGDLAKLDRTAIGERLGKEALRLQDLCSGKGTRLLRLVTPPRNYSAQIETDYEIQELEPLLFLLQRLLESVCSRLASAYYVAGAIDLTLTYTNETTMERNFRVPEPSADPEVLFQILHAWLETFTSEAPLCGIGITACPVQAHGQQRRLFEASIRNPARFAQTLAQLEALFGSANVGTPSPLPSHRPDAFVMTPFNYQTLELETDATSSRVREEAKSKKKSGSKTQPVLVEVARTQTGEQPLGLPMRRLRPPERIEVVTESATEPHDQRPKAILTGSVRGTLKDTCGPWAVSGDWWEPACWTRLEWDVCHESSGTLYRIYRDRSGWFLEGIYG